VKYTYSLLGFNYIKHIECIVGQIQLPVATTSNYKSKSLYYQGNSLGDNRAG